MRRNAIRVLWLVLLFGCQGYGTASPEFTADFTLPPDWTNTPPDVAAAKTQATVSPTGGSAITATATFHPGILPAETPTQNPLSITRENAPGLSEVSALGIGRMTDSAWSPDGRILAIIRPLGIDLYDADTGEFTDRIGIRGVEQIEYTHDGTHLAVAKGNTLWLIGEKDGVVECEMTTGMTRVDRMLVNPDGKSLLLAYSRIYRVGEFENGYEIVMEAWNVESGVRLFRFEDDGSISIGGLEYSPDGRWILFGQGWGSLMYDPLGISIIDSETGGYFYLVKAGFAEIWKGAYLPDGSFLALTYHGWKTYDFPDDGVLWDTAMPVNDEDRQILDIRVSSDGERILLFTTRGFILWDSMKDMQVVEISDVRPVEEEFTLFSPDGRYFVIGGNDYGLEKYDARTSEKHWRIPQSDLVTEITFLSGVPPGLDDAASPYLAMLNYDSGMAFWSVKENRLAAVFPYPPNLEPHVIAYEMIQAPDGTSIVFRLYSGEIGLYRTDAEGVKWIDSCRITGRSGMMLEFSPDGRTLKVDCAQELTLWNTADWSQAYRKEKSAETAYFFGPDGGLLVVESTAEGMRLSNDENPESAILCRLDSGPGGYCFEQITLNERYLSASETCRGTGLVIWDLSRLQAPIKAAGYILEVEEQGYVYYIGASVILFHPFEDLIALAYFNHVFLVDAQTGRQLLMLQPECGGEVRDLEFSRDGRYLAAACSNNITYVYGIT